MISPLIKPCESVKVLRFFILTIVKFNTKNYDPIKKRTTSLNSTIAFTLPVFREVISLCQSIIGFTMVQDLASSVVESLRLSLVYLFLERLQLCRLLVVSRTVYGLTQPLG